ncbi:MAG TPA: DUF5518 domain-containing protein, partial [Candidatus Omnitrophota bacterium]|nr:DUF5518 domain-containing protein [Candidatus Omnitrophota bacterium]
ILEMKLQLKWCRWSVVFLSTLSLVLALHFQNIYKLCQESWGVLLVGIVAPMAAGVYWKKANRKGAIAGALSGIISWILFKIFLPPEYPHNLLGFAVSCITLFIVSLVTQKPRSIR